MKADKKLKLIGFGLTIAGVLVQLASNNIESQKQTLLIKQEISEQLNTLLDEATKEES